jgi:hypothetical protein
VGGNVSPQKLTNLKVQVEDTKAKLESNDPAQIGTLTREQLLGDMFYAGTLGYYAQFNALTHLMGLQQKARQYLAAGYGTFGYEPNVDYLFGVPRILTTGGVAMDIPILRISGVDSQNAADRKNYNLQVGILSSILEHEIPEQLFNTDPQNPPDAISAVKALNKASSTGQRIYHITPDNMMNVLGRINHDNTTMNEITNALNSGKEVITHTDTVNVPGWSGAGYIIYDPVSGDGAYKIGGGANGSNLVLAISILLAAIAFFPGLAAYFGPLFIALMLVVVVVLTFVIVLDSLDGCQGDAGVGIALMLALLSAAPGEGPAIFRIFYEGFIISEGFVSISNRVCNL